MNWKPIETAPSDVPVITKIHDKDGCRNETVLLRSGGLWWYPDMSMYVYYTPTHWMAKEAAKPYDHTTGYATGRVD